MLISYKEAVCSGSCDFTYADPDATTTALDLAWNSSDGAYILTATGTTYSNAIVLADGLVQTIKSESATSIEATIDNLSKNTAV